MIKLIEKIFTSSVVVVFMIAVNPVQATNVYLAADTYDYDTGVGAIDLDYQPSGWAIGGAFDLSERLEFKYELGDWSDSIPLVGEIVGSSNFESSLVSVGLGYMMDKWTLNFSYSQVEDEKYLMFGPVNSLKVDADAKSYRLNLHYQNQSGPWAFGYEGSLLANQYLSETQVNADPAMVAQDQESLYGMVNVGADYYVSRTNYSGWYLGGAVSWFEEISNDMEIQQIGGERAEDDNNGRGGRRGDRGGNNVVVDTGSGDSGFINRTFGGSFGVASLYATYLINEHWSLDWTTTIGFSGEVNSTSHTLLLNYEF